MSESITIPAHIESGSVRLDAPLPPDVERVEVRVYLKARTGVATGLDLIAFLDALPLENEARRNSTQNGLPGRVADEEALMNPEETPSESETDQPVSEDEKGLLDARLADAAEHPDDESPWAEVRARLT